MTNRIITDISDYIFVSDEPQKVDAIFLPGGLHPDKPNMPQNCILKVWLNGLFRQVG